ncbi:hypothetical protein HZC07_01040 [Candidatus Micrarchaeota archaeon]|nr:hypothetical protein [Candidatus Micrarchaeota archaeon]
MNELIKNPVIDSNKRLVKNSSEKSNKNSNKKFVFESHAQYLFYLRVKKALEGPIAIGIAS